MRKFIILGLVSLAVVSCSKNDQSQSEGPTLSAPPASTPSGPDEPTDAVEDNAEAERSSE